MNYDLAPSPQAMQFWHLVESAVREQPLVLFLLLLLSFGISGHLIIRLWSRHRDASILRKMFWSLVLLVPVCGWILYGGLFRIPSPAYASRENSIGF